MSYLYCTENDVKKALFGLDISDLPASLSTAVTEKYIPWAGREFDRLCGTNLGVTEVEEEYDGSGTSKLILRHRPIREVISLGLYIIPSSKWVNFFRWYYVGTTDIRGTKIAKSCGIEPVDDATPPYTFAEGSGFVNEGVTPTATFAATETQYGRTDLLIDCSKGILTIPPQILISANQAFPYWNYTWITGSMNVRIKYTYGYSDPNAEDALLGTDHGNLPLEISDAVAGLAACYVLQDKGLWIGAGAKSRSIDGVTQSFGDRPYEGHIKAFQERATNVALTYKQPRV